MARRPDGRQSHLHNRPAQVSRATASEAKPQALISRPPRGGLGHADGVSDRSAHDEMTHRFLQSNTGPGPIRKRLLAWGLAQSCRTYEPRFAKLLGGIA